MPELMPPSPPICLLRVGPGGLLEFVPPDLDADDLLELLESIMNKVWKNKPTIRANPWKNSVMVPILHRGRDSKISPRSLMYGILQVSRVPRRPDQNAAPTFLE